MDERLQYSISRLAPDDSLDDVVSLEAQSFSNPWSREILARDLQNPDVSRVYVLRTGNGALLAFCACWVIVDELHINTLAVTPAMQRRGLATRLLRHVLAEASAAGGRRATLEVRRSNAAALRLYEQLGFHLAGVRRDYYSNPVEDGLILWSSELGALDADPEP
jgi:ribosomal-protein-alanine N-acetyltransferase